MHRDKSRDIHMQIAHTTFAERNQLAQQILPAADEHAKIRLQLRNHSL